jgi:hypothetical protein
LPITVDPRVANTPVRLALSGDTLVVARPYVVPDVTYRVDVSFHRRVIR